MDLGDIIRQHREARRLTRAQLALLAPLWTEDRLKHVEAGTTTPQAHALQQLVDVLDLPADKVRHALRVQASNKGRGNA